MSRADDAVFIIGEKNRRAVGRADTEDNAGGGGNGAVRFNLVLRSLGYKNAFVADALVKPQDVVIFQVIMCSDDFAVAADVFFAVAGFEGGIEALGDTFGNTAFTNEEAMFFLRGNWG